MEQLKGPPEPKPFGNMEDNRREFKQELAIDFRQNRHSEGGLISDWGWLRTNWYI